MELVLIVLGGFALLNLLAFAPDWRDWFKRKR
jgi:hypothetical protein